jgi:hypothetical protein
MTTDILHDEVHKVSYNDNLERILSSLVYENGICKTCGHDHGLKVTLEGITFTINQIYKLFEETLEVV